MRRPIFRLCHVWINCLAVLGAPAFAAASTADAETVKLPDVIVTAQKTTESLQRTAASVSVLGGLLAEDAQIVDVQSIQSQVPNLRYADYLGRGYFGFLTIRGFVNSRRHIDPSATLYIDDVPYSDFYAYNQTLYDVESIEVLRGPQSTLYGGFSQAGIVAIRTRAPGDASRAMIRAGYESFDRYSATVSASMPLVAGKLSLGVAGNINRGDSFITNVATGRRPEQREVSGRVRVRWTPVERLELNLVAGLTRLDDEGAQQLVPVDRDGYNAALTALGTSLRVGEFEQAFDFDGERQNRNNHQSLSARWQGESIEAISVTARREYNSETSLDFDLLPLPLLNTDIPLRTSEWSQEVRVQSLPTASDRFFWLGGVNESSAKQHFRQSADDLAGLYGGVPGAHYEVFESWMKGQMIGLFGQGRWRFARERANATLGLRYDRATREARQPANPFYGPGFPWTSKDTTALLPKIALDYQIAPERFVYASAAAGWKPGGVNQIAPDLATALYNKETSWTWEAGIKSRWLDERLQLNASVFHTDVRDFQDEIMLDPVHLVLANAERVSIEGGEIELMWKPHASIQMDASLGVARARYEDYLRNRVTGFRYDGMRVAQVPDHNFHVGLTWRFVPRWTLRLDAEGADDFNAYQYATAPTEKFTATTVDGHFVTHVKLGYEAARWSAHVYVQNVADEQYFVHADSVALAGYTGVLGTVGRPRVVGTVFTLNF